MGGGLGGWEHALQQVDALASTLDQLISQTNSQSGKNGMG